MSKYSSFSREGGHTLVELLVGLLLFSLLLLMITPIFKYLALKIYTMQQKVEVLNSVVQVNNIIEQDLSEIIFTPICPGMLPSYHSMELGEGVDESIRLKLVDKVIISKPPLAQQQSLLDFKYLKGRGAAHYSPKLVKNLSGLVEGSSVVLIRGLQLIEAQIHNAAIIGQIPERYRGLKELQFYLTDCRHSLFMRGKLKGDALVIADADREKIDALFKTGAQIYLFREQLIYLQKNGERPTLVIDYFDGQAFIRIANIYDFRVQRGQDDTLNFLLVAGSPSVFDGRIFQYVNRDYQRAVANSAFIYSFSFPYPFIFLE